MTKEEKNLREIIEATRYFAEFVMTESQFAKYKSILDKYGYKSNPKSNRDSL